MKKRLITLLTTTMMITSIFGVTGCGAKADKLTMDKSNFDLELGEDPSQNYTPYIPSTYKGDINDLRFDFSKVDYEKVGTYEATLTLEEEVEKFKITVVDTIAPEVEIKKDIKVLVNNPLMASSILTNITECSQNITVEFDDYLGAEKNKTESATPIGNVNLNGDTSIVYTAVGEYDNGITVTDENGNSSHYDIHVVVKENPAINGVVDKTITVGETIDYLAGVTATDSQGADLTASIEVDSSAVDTNTVGNYTVTYKVVDSDGFTGSINCNVTVNEKVAEVEKPAETKPSNNQSSSNKNNDSNSNSNNSASNSGSSGSNEVAQTPPTPEPEPTPEPTPEPEKSIWKYDTAYAYKVMSPDGMTWADGSPVKTVEYDAALGGRNRDAALYLLAGGAMSQRAFDEQYGN